MKKVIATILFFAVFSVYANTANATEQGCTDGTMVRARLVMGSGGSVHVFCPGDGNITCCVPEVPCE